jgi:hypothetical protein
VIWSWSIQLLTGLPIRLTRHAFLQESVSHPQPKRGFTILCQHFHRKTLAIHWFYVMGGFLFVVLLLLPRQASHTYPPRFWRAGVCPLRWPVQSRLFSRLSMHAETSAKTTLVVDVDVAHYVSKILEEGDKHRSDGLLSGTTTQLMYFSIVLHC